MFRWTGQPQSFSVEVDLVVGPDAIFDIVPAHVAEQSIDESIFVDDAIVKQVDCFRARAVVYCHDLFGGGF